MITTFSFIVRILNKLKINLFFPFKNRNKLIYIVEDANWAIKWVGYYIVKTLKKSGIQCTTDKHFSKYKNKIIHFGARGLYLPEGWKNIDPSNKVIFTYFHGDDNDIIFINALKEASQVAKYFHTSCTKTKQHLIKYGVPEEKIVIIPLGIDENIFSSIDELEKIERKRRLGIPDGHFVIGSFQKDGIGWKNGEEPKLVKGPDIFCDAVEKISKDIPVFIVLTGPARGYVKSRLEKAKIPYIHHNLKNYKKLAFYYSLLDCYIISSRLEGGPMSILEGQASGIPVVSTPVGIVPDICTHDKDVLLCENVNADEIVKNVLLLFNNKDLYDNLKENGLINAEKYSWSNIAKIYYEKLYSKL